jgi:hypothetical protein
MFQHIRAFFICSLALSFTLSSVVAYSVQDKPSFESLLELVKKRDPAADFTALRLAYFDNPPKKAGDADPKLTDSMLSAMRDKKYGKAIEYAEKIIQDKYVDINAHLVASAANKEQGDAEKEKFHKYVAGGLINSILNSGDGKKPETAFTVISTDEEYVILRYYGLMPERQALLEEKGHYYDRLDGVNPKTNEKVSLYFNIDRPYGALLKIFKQ